MSGRLHKNTPVRIEKHRPGWLGRIEHYSAPCGFYTVRLTYNARGERVAGKRYDGPYCRNELTPLTGSSPGPAIDATDGVHFSTRR